MQYPDWLKNKKAIITTKNKDEECFNLLSQLLYIMKNLIIIQKKINNLKSLTDQYD